MATATKGQHYPPLKQKAPFPILVSDGCQLAMLGELAFGVLGLSSCCPSQYTDVPVGLFGISQKSLSGPLQGRRRVGLQNHITT